VLGKENSGTGGRDVLPPLDVDSINGPETGPADPPDELIEEIVPSNGHGFNTRRLGVKTNST
jgi:hypothetical protein